MQGVSEAAFFSAGDRHQLEKRRLDLLDLVRLGVDIGDDGQLGHGRNSVKCQEGLSCSSDVIILVTSLVRINIPFSQR
jgi:hypothetical protein